MTELTSTKSWKMKGEIGKHTIVVLIDCGASHNFVSKKLVEELQLTIEDTPTYNVEVGDGHKVAREDVLN